MTKFNVYTIMLGIGRIHFFQDKPQWLRKISKSYAGKITSKDLDIDKFMANVGFYQR
jgi:hypothetical protein